MRTGRAIGRSFVSPLVEFDRADYSASDLATAELLLAAPDVLVDGSDAMPVDYGSTLFWSAITDGSAVPRRSSN